MFRPFTLLLLILVSLSNVNSIPVLSQQNTNWFISSKKTPNFTNWTSISSSNDGKTLIALSPRGRGGIFVSNDYGKEWKLKYSVIQHTHDGDTDSEDSVENKWQAASISGNGLIAIALINGGRGFRSFNGGQNWALLHNVNASNIHSLSDEPKGWYKLDPHRHLLLPSSLYHSPVLLI